MTDTPALRVSNIVKTYHVGTALNNVFSRKKNRHTTLTALAGVDLELRKGEILALVGESGSGKSTLAKILVRSIKPTSGELFYGATLVPDKRTKETAKRIQMVFQDPYSSLNPRLTVKAILAELLILHRIVPRKEVRAESIRLLNRVGLEESALDAYPSQFSGGQRQRLAIARALAVRPDILIADEPVSALDVSVQATILELLTSLQKELSLSILFIGHNLAVVQHLSQRVAVMYLGRIVEIADTADLFANPRHPYTRALIESVPRMTDHAEDEFVIKGEPPSPLNLPAGCRFHPRCSYAVDKCRTDDPPLMPVEDEHESACWRIDELPVFSAAHMAQGKP